ncbi:MAG: hypothetical protein Q8L78_03155 [Coxiellaceae bacterium]|nr:hypothetical protein [Coxiellaceae bacterium]
MPTQPNRYGHLNKKPKQAAEQGAEVNKITDPSKFSAETERNFVVVAPEKKSSSKAALFQPAEAPTADVDTRYSWNPTRLLW